MNEMHVDHAIFYCSWNIFVYKIYAGYIKSINLLAVKFCSLYVCIFIVYKLFDRINFEWFL